MSETPAVILRSSSPSHASFSYLSDLDTRGYPGILLPTALREHFSSGILGQHTVVSSKQRVGVVRKLVLGDVREPEFVLPSS